MTAGTASERAAAPRTGQYPPPVRHLRRRLRRMRRGHSDRTLGDLLTDVYLIAFLVVLYGGSAAASLRRHLARPFAGPVGLATTRAWLVVALLVVLAALAWRGLRGLGPLITTPAALSWCLSTPIDRAGWLRTPLAWLLATSAVVGAAVGVLAGWAGHPDTVQAGAAPLAWAALAGGAGGVALAATGVVAQSWPQRRRRLRPSDVVLALGLLLVAAGVATRLAHIHTPPPAPPAPLLAAIAMLLAGGAGWAAWRALGRVDRSALASGSQVGTAAVTAAVMLDPSLVLGLLESRRWRQHQRVHSRRFRPGGRRWMLVQADLFRLRRRPGSLVTWAALLLAPYASAAFSPAVASSVRIVAAYLATQRLAAGLRLVARSPALRRALGGTDRELKQAHLIVPGVTLLLWWALTEGSLGALTPPLLLVVLVGGVLAAVYRTATRPPMSYDAGLADTPMGPVPTLLLRRLLRGPDLVAVLVLVDLFL